MQSEVLVTHELKVDKPWEFKETYSCSKQAYEATTRQVAREEYTLTHNSQGTHLDLPSDSQAWTAK
jgi:sigma54-dependent transcription regulator